MIADLPTTTSRVEQDRTLHTLKGNAGMIGFEAFAELCHHIESELRESDGGVTPEHLSRIATAWDHVVRTLRSLLGDSSRDMVLVDRRDLDAALVRARAGASGSELGILLAAWTDEPVERRFERLGQQASALAKRLGKGHISISIADNGVRLDQHWAALWGSLVHVVRNAIDHGIESPEDRQRAGKSEPKLTFSARRTDRDLVIEIADDGAGVNWDAIRAKAERLGLPSRTQMDLVDAMFADGLSTRDVATNTSGRGIGLSAVKSVVVALGGSIDVTSTPGEGTRMQLRFAAPRFTMTRAARLVAHP
jgi:two-component system chemotaxis sensor kinase CheA